VQQSSRHHGFQPRLVSHQSVLQKRKRVLFRCFTVRIQRRNFIATRDRRVARVKKLGAGRLPVKGGDSDRNLRRSATGPALPTSSGTGRTRRPTWGRWSDPPPCFLGFALRPRAPHRSAAGGRAGHTLPKQAPQPPTSAWRRPAARKRGGPIPTAAGHRQDRVGTRSPRPIVSGGCAPLGPPLRSDADLATRLFARAPAALILKGVSRISERLGRRSGCGGFR